MGIVNVRISKRILLDLFGLSHIDYEITNVRNVDDEIIIFEFAGNDLPEPINSKIKNAEIICRNMQSRFEIYD